MEHQPYKTADGKRAPSTTTITGRFKPAEAIIAWAWKLGTEGKDYRTERDTAANIGTVAHDIIQLVNRGAPDAEVEALVTQALPDPAHQQQAYTSAEGYLQWARKAPVQILHEELALVSETHRFGGRLDAVGTVGGSALALLDWKSSNGVYVEYILQLAAYGLLWEEHHPEQPLTGYHLLRFPKDEAGFEHYQFTPEQLIPAREQFLGFRAAYEREKGLKKLLKEAR